MAVAVAVAVVAAGSRLGGRWRVFRCLLEELGRWLRSRGCGCCCFGFAGR